MGNPKRAARAQPRYKLLVVDDDWKIGHLLEEYFVRRGYEVRAVQRGEEALRLADVFQPQVVVLDVLMPGLSGVDTLKRLKALPSAPRVIMLSVADDERVMQGALQLGADFYVCKPVNFADLERLVSGFFPPAV